MLIITTKINQAELDAAIHALEMLGSHKLPNMASAVERATLMAQQKWLDNTRSVFKHSSEAYREGIDEGFIYPKDGDPYKGAVINRAPHAAFIENGTKSHDLKKALFTSSKVRISKQGKRYLIIPFRHGTPRSSRIDRVTGLQIEAGKGTQRATLQSMPKSVYQQAKQMAFYQTGQNPNKGARTRLTLQQIRAAGADVKLQPQNKTNPFVGMVRIRRHTTAPGSIYMTFRVMSEESKGWIHPGTPPMHLARKTANEIAPVVRQMLKDGFEADMKDLGLK